MAKEVKDGLRASARETEAQAFEPFAKSAISPSEVNARKFLLLRECQDRFGLEAAQSMAELAEDREMSLAEIFKLSSRDVQKALPYTSQVPPAPQPAQVLIAQRDEGEDKKTSQEEQLYPAEALDNPNRFLKRMQSSFGVFSAGAETEGLRLKAAADPKRLILFSRKDRYDNALATIAQYKADCKAILSGNGKHGKVGGLVTAKNAVERFVEYRDRGALDKLPDSYKADYYFSCSMLTQMLNMKYELVGNPSKLYEVMDAPIIRSELEDAMHKAEWIRWTEPEVRDSGKGWSVGPKHPWTGRKNMTHLRPTKRSAYGKLSQVCWLPWVLCLSGDNALARLVYNYRLARSISEKKPVVFGRPWCDRDAELQDAYLGVEKLFKPVCEGV